MFNSYRKKCKHIISMTNTKYNLLLIATSDTILLIDRSCKRRKRFIFNWAPTILKSHNYFFIALLLKHINKITKNTK